MIRYFLFMCLVACPLLFLACTSDELVESPKGKHFGVHEECDNIGPKYDEVVIDSDFIKNSINYENCCKKHNSCWTLMKYEYAESIDTVRITYRANISPIRRFFSWVCSTAADPVRHRDFCTNNPNPTSLKLQRKADFLCKDTEKENIALFCKIKGFGK
ncbi:MAG: hypothetical protein LBU89_09575 [Fibromonadaceae bacterium]|jgi:hypothetical protein|nr:hypothetical protein [Fibromonadaceae bacterium]